METSVAEDAIADNRSRELVVAKQLRPANLELLTLLILLTINTAKRRSRPSDVPRQIDDNKE